MRNINNNKFVKAASLKTDGHFDKNIQFFINKNRNYTHETQKFFFESQNLTARLRTEENDDEKFNSNNSKENLTSLISKTPRNTTSSIANLKKKIIDLNHSITLDNRNLNQFPIHYYNYISGSVKILDLKNNNIKKLPDEIANFLNLEVIKLDNNSLQALPIKVFSKLTPKFVSISNNYFKSIPCEIEKWGETLEYFNVSVNFISNLPVEITKLKNLKSLHINNNSFISIPRYIFKLTNLKEIGLDWFKYATHELKNINILQIAAHSTFFSNFLNFLRGKNEEYIYFKEFLEEFQRKAASSIKKLPNLPLEKIIFEATFNEDLGILRFLISEHPDNLINFVNEQGHTPLSYAISEEKYLSAKLLIQNGSNVNIGGGEYGSPFNLSITKLQFYLVKDLLKFGANPNLSNKKGDYSLNFLFNEWENQQPICEKIFNLLMENSASPNIRNEEGICPLHIVIIKKLKEPLNLILDFNKNVSDKQKCFDFSKKTKKKKYSCLHLAALSEDSEALYKILSETKSSEQIFDTDVNGNRPIHLAKQNYTSIKILRKFEKEFLKENFFANKKKKICLSKKDVDSDVISHEDEIKDTLTTRMKEIHVLNIKNNNFHNLLNKSFITKNSLISQNNLNFNKNSIKLPAHKLRLYTNDNEENESSLDSLKTDLEEENNDYSQNPLVSHRKIKFKKLPISPNNIRKIERIQKYSNYFIRNQTSNHNVPSFRKLNLDTASDENSLAKKKEQNFFLFNIYKTVFQKFEKYKKDIEEYHGEVIQSKNLLSTKIHFLFLIIKIHHKILKIAMDLLSKKISLGIMNVNFFESCQINEEEINLISKSSKSQKFLMVFYELMKIIQDFDNNQSDEEKYSVFSIKYEIFSFFSFFNAGALFKELLNINSLPEIMKYEIFLSHH